MAHDVTSDQTRVGMGPLTFPRRGLLAVAIAAVAAPSAAGDSPMDPREAEIRTTVERYAEAWRAGDLAAIAGLYHETFTLHYGGAHALSGDHVGKAAALGVLAEFSRRTSRKLLGVVAVMSGPERGAIVAREVFRKGEAVAELERLLVYAVRDGQLSECWVYDADPALVARFVGD